MGIKLVVNDYSLKFDSNFSCLDQQIFILLHFPLGNNNIDSRILQIKVTYVFKIFFFYLYRSIIGFIISANSSLS